MQRQLDVSDSFDSHQDSHSVKSNEIYSRLQAQRLAEESENELMSELTHSDLLGSASSED